MELSPFPAIFFFHFHLSQFTDVLYATPVSRSITIENIGEVAAIWRFIPKPEEKVFGSVSPRCLAVVLLTCSLIFTFARKHNNLHTSPGTYLVLYCQMPPGSLIHLLLF